MLNSHAIQLMNQALWLVLILSAPPILAASIVGLLVAIAQSATQLQEQTVQYSAKFFTIVITLFLTASLVGGALYSFGNDIFDNIPSLVRQ